MTCQSCTKLEDAENYEFTSGGFTRHHLSNLKLDLMSKWNHMPDVHRRSRSWRAIVCEYSKRRVTKPSDKLPAVAGIARWLLGDLENNDNYVAGLLKDDLHRGLAWYVNTESPRPPATEYICPSWSWASVHGPITHLGYRSRNVSDRAIIEKVELELKGIDPYGQINFASLKLRAKVKVAYINIGKEYASRGGNVYSSTSNDAKCIGLFRADYPHEWMTVHGSGVEAEGVAKIPEKRHRRATKFLCLETDPIGYFHALAIEPVEADESLPAPDAQYARYRRTGLLEELSESVENWFRDADWECIELV